jgi:NADPH-dependent ferric siderophore reductase
MRTYTIRTVRGSGVDTRLVVDLVLHPDHGGPGSSWAESAALGDRLVVVAPRRGVPYGGIEFAPGDARDVLLVGDETAVPAVCAILESLPRGFRGRAVLEVPRVGDVLPVTSRSDVVVEWLPREGRPLGERLVAAVLGHLGGAGRAAEVEDVDPDLWETPTYSSSGEPVDDVYVLGHDLAGLYAWIAGESAMVTTLRRALVGELGMSRRQVAFMGYWRQGVAMKS